MMCHNLLSSITCVKMFLGINHVIYSLIFLCNNGALVHIAHRSHFDTQDTDFKEKGYIVHMIMIKLVIAKTYTISS